MPNPPLVVLIEDNVGDARWFWMQLRDGGVLCDVTSFNTVMLLGWWSPSVEAADAE